MDVQQEEKLSQLVEDLTTSGQQTLNPEQMRELKKICKSSEECVKHAYHLIMRQLNQEHSEIRLSAFQIANELFVRSSQFRLLLVSNFQEFLELTIENDYEQPLPPPKEAAQKLKKMAIKAVQEWQDKYGNAYKKLSLGYHFLKQVKKVDFQDIRARTQAERKREEERLKRQENINNVRVKRVEEEMKGLKIEEDEDNSAIINNIKDLQRLITNKYLPTVRYWIQAFTKAGITDARLRRAIDLKSAIDAAVKKHDELNISYKERERKVMKAADEDDDDDDDDFVEVPEKEGYEPHIQEHLREEYGLEPLIQKTEETVKRITSCAGPPPWRRKDEELDPTCAAATLKIWKEQLSSRMCSLAGTSEDNVQASTSAGPELFSEDAKKRKMEEMKRAPVMSFGLDLHYWGEEQTTSGKIPKIETPHRFLESKQMEDDSENAEMAALLKTRYITFAGKFEPVKHRCQAPMPNGTLCERQDRFKCPFHGKIISRDAQGNPVNPEDIQRLKQEEEKKQKEKADWRDPELMRDIEAATGADLGSSRCEQKGKGKKGKGKKKKYPNLTDLNQENNTTRSRLEKRVFNKASLKRVSKAMASLDKRKHEKFANQFNYALN
ncbi:UV-stimulated scaffold protein A isoform X2 [Mobula hypostoma]|uniref:UV-stimulated scaffold protein A isoform X2 n=1 Tax=Mobula hypostoma TaxID=723540 RepID=UPI002FC28579